MPPMLTLKAKAQYLTMEQWNEGLSPADESQLLSVGDKVQYMAHLAGGMVKVKLSSGECAVIHPGSTSELS